jgi:hypothetical protein
MVDSEMYTGIRERVIYRFFACGSERQNGELSNPSDERVIYRFFASGSERHSQALRMTMGSG